MMPDLVAPGGMTKKLKAKRLELFNNLPVFEPGKTPHAGLRSPDNERIIEILLDFGKMQVRLRFQ